MVLLREAEGETKVGRGQRERNANIIWMVIEQLPQTCISRFSTSSNAWLQSFYHEGVTRYIQCISVGHLEVFQELPQCHLRTAFLNAHHIKSVPQRPLCVIVLEERENSSGLVA